MLLLMVDGMICEMEEEKKWEDHFLDLMAVGLCPKWLRNRYYSWTQSQNKHTLDQQQKK